MHPSKANLKRNDALSQSRKIEAQEEDPFFGLKLIAFHRSTFPKDSEELTEDELIAFARWQICKSRNILWNDPIWQSYTHPEILIEFFAIKFDEDQELRDKFAASLVQVQKKDLDWFAQMEAKLTAEAASKPPSPVVENSKIEQLVPKPEAAEPIEFEDKF